MDERTPILIGGGQITQRDVDPAAALEPVELMREAARRAAEDASLSADVLGKLDSVQVVNILSWAYPNAPRLLAERLGACPREEIYTTIGGNSPQSLVNETALRIAEGKVGIALLAGAEAMHTMAHARRTGVRLAWSSSAAEPPTMVGDDRNGISAHEAQHGLVLPVQVYPLFENALRAKRGRTPVEHTAALGELYARFSRVAAENPYAWFREPRSAADIATVTEQNRIIAFPYPKFMNAIIDVDQSAAVLMTSVGTARALGVPRERWVFLQGCGEAHDLWFVSERRDFTSSPAIRAAGEHALAMAGVGIAVIEMFDLYSCFPSAVQLAQDALGIADDDPRPLTVTGGLAAFGGPGNNYSMHAIASMLERVRGGARGLVTALGWYATKHAVGIYGAEPGPQPLRATPASVQDGIDAMPHPELVERPEGPATIETYTVVHDRGGVPARGVMVGRLSDGRRCLALIDGGEEVLRELERREGVGRSGVVGPDDDGANRFFLE